METRNGELLVAKSQDKTEKPNALIEIARRLNLLFNTNVIGRKNIETIPRGKNIIIATSHIDNWSVGLAINALSYYFNNITVAE